MFHIKLANQPMMKSIYSEYCKNSSRFYNTAKGLTTINVRPLCLAIIHKTGFLPSKRVICIMFLFLNSQMQLNDVSISRAWEKGPSLVRNKCLIILLHDISPVRVSKGL